MSLHQTYVKSRVGHALQGRAALGRRRVDESMPMRLKQVRIGRPAPICRRRGAAFSNLQPRDPSRGACSPSRAFRAAPRAVVGLKRGGGGVVHPCIGHAESVVASGPLTCRSKKGKYAGGVAPRARRSAPGCPYSHTAPPGDKRLLARVGPGTRACDSSNELKHRRRESAKDPAVRRAETRVCMHLSDLPHLPLRNSSNVRDEREMK